MKLKISLLIIFICSSFSRGLFAQTLIPSEEDAKQSLNGKWYFKYIPSADIADDSLFYKPDYDVDSWSKINVPSNWELQGFAEPTYGKKLKNGTGLYRTQFDVPTHWKGNSIYIAFGGVQTGYTVWVNGKYVGEFASAFNLQTFDISPYVNIGGENTLAVKVITQPKGWEFDTNDDWSLSGIYRDVTLFTLSPVHIEDLVIKTRVNPASSNIDISAKIEKISNVKFSKKLNIQGELLDASGTVIEKFILTPEGLKNKSNIVYVNGVLKVENPKLWTAETPYLYTLRLLLKDNDAVLQKYTERIGIREVTWTNGVLKLNGSPIKLKGINHHNLTPSNGRAITESEMKKDLELMRKGNINFIRTAHYPPQPRLLELCDSLGFYVMNEIPYGYGDELLTDTSYLPILKTRAKATIWRDKNRPSVIIWSVGNENPVTEIGLITGRYVKSLDDTRPYCFPQTPTVFKNMMEALPDSIDMLDFHYPQPSEIKEFAKTIEQPLIASEYAHALGLDFGMAEEIYEVMYIEPKLAGGAVWKLFDQGILRKSQNKISKGESTIYVWTDENTIYDTGGNQGTDGIVYADRTPQTDFFQMRKIYTPVKALDDTLYFRGGNQNFEIKIQNRYDFTDLAAVKFKWELYADTTIINSGIVPLKGNPHETITASINTTLPETPAALFYYLRLTVEDKEHFQVYEKTYPLYQQKSTVDLIDKIGSPNAKPILKANAVESNDYQFEFEEQSGITQLKNGNGVLLIADGMFARVGRKPSMAQDATTTSRRSKIRHTLWNPFLLTDPKVKVIRHDAEQLRVNYTYQPDSMENRAISGEITYDFSDRGYINVHYNLLPKGQEEAVETGLSFVIPSSFTEFKWIGKGPYAAYPGKDRLSEFGVYHLNSNDLYFAGNRQDVECAVFTDVHGNGFALIANKANIAVERTEKGIVVSHNAHVSSVFNKYEWPQDLYSFKESDGIKGMFTIVPFSTTTWPSVLNDLFGDNKKITKAFQPFYHSYDQ
ncbi:glycoside hydrolase family 2 TIM barrel-domain containing protein [Sphingobacterium corticibacterium]|uniref:Beta-galactosidase n=1 Tax=Sphingobacterium corticibacterium TaxID=2484746 RepID=A0A4Q6XT81_9SPHI|nr:glycoside hydrolase family 2 TIM barrel-domain containing protein [Sphingobacterium corticibacterium]RZF59777.1 hypothetical protein EWE74_11525 [Sphingobacterium corticibacterium]